MFQMVRFEGFVTQLIASTPRFHSSRNIIPKNALAALRRLSKNARSRLQITRQLIFYFPPTVKETSERNKSHLEDFLGGLFGAKTETFLI